MNRYEQTTIWQKTLAKQLEPDSFEKERDILRVAYEGFRENAKLLAGEISNILPEYTVHDITHIDALWETAELVAKDSFELTPTEVFVLGGAFLIHDLGMGLASFPNGVDELKLESIWQDTMSSIVNNGTKELTCRDNIYADAEKIATEYTLRLLHAKQAEKLALISWTDKENNQIYLMDNYELREAYGRIIGLIAYSHWWKVDELEDKFNSILGAPGMFPPIWTIDPLKLACVLRIADAVQIDDRRAPNLLRTVRDLSDVSDSHWNFQRKLYQPRLERNKLVFTSKTPFTINEVESWWVCHDTLKMIDEELNLVDSLLIDTNRKRLNASGISAIEDPKRLSKLISVQGWQPININVKVSNVAKLVGCIGGSQLYGENLMVPLRELIQNAADAIRARRVLENENGDFGSIIVRIGEDADGTFIEVEDNGVGMSQKVLTGPFLDFGNSLWGTPLMHEELPSLESKGFSSTGRYGIGFFSVFMWGKKVSITTRRYEKGRDATLVLEFNNGVSSRPILRKANSLEFIKEGGTKVRVWLSNESILEKILVMNSHRKSQKTFAELIETLCPSMDCNIVIEENNNRQTVIRANDWKTISSIELLKRVLGRSEFNDLEPKLQSILYEFSKNMSVIIENDEVVARALIIKETPTIYAKSNSIFKGIVTVGGVRTSELWGIVGIFIGDSERASRDIGIPLVAEKSLQNWASNQAELISKLALDLDMEEECASIVRRCGGNTKKLKVAYHNGNAINYNEIKEIMKELKSDTYVIFSDSKVHIYERDNKCKIKYIENTFWADCGIPAILQCRDIESYIFWPESIKIREWFHSATLQGLIIEALSEIWNTSVNEIIESSNISSDDESFKGTVGYVEGESVIFDHIDIIKMPKGDSL
ncbi:HD domain-containing protein [Clostridium minihomine]|uniref:HD domain-containing protein n=1 Tax=Clostridium minihomine TaxID=2045012 RepID=UPI0013EDF0EC|nr:ATP-binding protein [Clostridium minihomine]